MASNSAVRDQNSGRPGTFDQRRVARAIPEVWAGLLTILISGPWLGGGYIFGTDWPGPGVPDVKKNLQEFRALGLPKGIRDQILTQTALGIWPE